MANLVAGGMKSLDQQWETAGANGDKIKAAWDLVVDLPLKSRPKPKYDNLPLGEVKLMDLPIVPLDKQAKSCKHPIDVIEGYKGAVNIELIKSLMDSNNYFDLPLPFGPKSKHEVGFTMGLTVLETAPGEHTIIKCYEFEEMMLQTVFRASFATDEGDVYVPYWSKNRSGTKKVIHHMVEAMGGHRWRYTLWPEECPTRKKGPQEVSSLEAGFEVLEKKSRELKLTDIDNRITRFAEIEINSPESHVFGWSGALVERSLRNHSKSHEAAKTITDFFQTLDDTAPWFREHVLKEILGNWLSSTFMLIGKSGIGKSPIAKILAMLFSHYHIANIEGRNGIARACFRTTSDFEHMKYEPGRIERSEIYDDGKLQMQPPERVKAFNDNTEEERRTVQRYTGCVWPGQQGRITNNNPYDASGEPGNAPTSGKIQFEMFFKMIRPTFHKDMEREDVIACIKRSNVVLCTDRRVYYWAGHSRGQPFQIEVQDRFN